MNRLSSAVLLSLAWVLPGLAQAPPSPAPRFPAESQDEAWKLLPRKAPSLPTWALVLVQSLPRTTGAMLELDHFHRTKNPLGPVLAGKLRWIAAEISSCAYAKSYAEADLKRAGLGEEGLRKWVSDRSELSPVEQGVLAFARKMTRAPHTVTDDEMSELLKQHGPEKVVAMVHTLAHANFQNRLFLAMGIEVEAGGPLLPAEPQLDAARRADIPTPKRPAWEELTKGNGPKNPISRPAWRDLSFDDLEKAMEGQRTRKARIALLSPEKLTHLPPSVREHARKVIWSNVSLGYQPEMTNAWFNVMNTFMQEAKLPRLFSGSMFWIITRSNECFY